MIHNWGWSKFQPLKTNFLKFIWLNFKETNLPMAVDVLEIIVVKKAHRFPTFDFVFKIWTKLFNPSAAAVVYNRKIHFFFNFAVIQSANGAEWVKFPTWSRPVYIVSLAARHKRLKSALRACEWRCCAAQRFLFLYNAVWAFVIQVNFKGLSYTHVKYAHHYYKDIAHLL